MNSSVGVGGNMQTRQVRQFSTSTQLHKFLFSDEMCLALQKLFKYDLQLIISLSASELKEACHKELRRLQALKLKDKIPRNLYLDNELAATAISHQLRAIAELQKANQEALRKLNYPQKKGNAGEAKEELVARRYEAIQGQIQKSQGQVRAFMESEVLGRAQIDLQLCYGFFGKHARRLKRNSSEKLIISRAHLLDALAYCLRQVQKMINHEQHVQEQKEKEESQDEQPSSDSQGEEVTGQNGELEASRLSYRQINRWKRMASRVLSDKMDELSTVCQQIPQLQAFSRTLQFSQLGSGQRVSFLRVVDVLVSLHHRVSYLSRNKPQLLRELELAQEELLALNNGCQEFLLQIDQRASITQLATLRIEGEARRHGQLSEGFLQIRRLLGRLTQVIINQDLAHTAGFDRADRLLQLVRLFLRAHHGREAEEWEQLVSELAGDGAQGVSEEEYELVMELQECLLDFQGRASIEQHSNSKTNEELQEEVNKLIADYQRLKADNRQQLDSLEMLSRLKEELEVQIQERDNMIYNLSGIKVTLEKRLAANEGTGESARALEEELKKQQRETQKYLESSLLLRQQLKVSENQREKLLQLLQAEKEKNLKLLEANTRLKPQKERLQLQNQQLQERVEKMKNDHQRSLSKLNKQLNDLTNQRDLLDQQLATAENNKTKLLQRLQASEKRISDYSRLVITRVEDTQREGRQHTHSHSQEIVRLEQEVERVRRDLERSRKECEGKRAEIDILEKENGAYQLQVTALKAKLKEGRISQEENQEKDDLIREFKGKFDKATIRISALLKEMEGIREEEEQTASRNRTISKRIKELENSLADSESEISHLSQELQQKNITNSELQKSLTSQTAQLTLQIKHLKQINARQEEELRERGSKNDALQRKLQRLEAELASRRAQGQQTSKELVEVRVKQYETTIQTQKLLQVKLQEKARTLKSQLQQKIEVEIKLNLEIDRLSKEIDRMKQQLDKFMRQLSQKEFLIKAERQKNEQQLKIIREFQVKEKIQSQGLTPIRPHNDKRREDDTPSHIDDHKRQDFPQGDSNSADNSILSKSNIKYDIYFNAKEYDRLQKEYNEFRMTVGQKVEELERLLNEARMAKVDLEIKHNTLVIENKRIISSRAINSGNNSVSKGENSDNAPSPAEWKQLQQAKLSLDRQLQQGNNAIAQYQSTINSLNHQLAQLQKQISSHQMEISQLRQRQSERGQSQQQLSHASSKIAELEARIGALQKENENLTREKQASSKYALELEALLRQKAALEQELSQAKVTITNLSANPANNAETEKLRRTVQELKDQISRLQKERRAELDTLTREKEQMGRERELVARQREGVRQEHEEIRKRLVEETKRGGQLEAQIAKLREELKKKESITAELLFARKKVEELEGRIAEKQAVNVEYYLEKIKALEEALLAVREELTHAKDVSFAGSREYNAMMEDIQRLFNDNQYFHQANQQLAIQIEQAKRNENQWAAKERLYLQKLEALSRENVSLKDLISKPNDKQITTNLPPKLNPVNINYHQSREDLRRERSHDFEKVLRQINILIQSRNGWEISRIMESLNRWRVPTTVSTTIQELLTYLSQAIELLKVIRQDYANIRDMNPNAVLFQNLMEFVLRVLVYFSEIPFNSAEAGKIKGELAETAKKYSGGIFFTVLEEYTIHVLENNAIEEYKRELRAKATELLFIKEKLDELITRQIKQEEQMINRPLQQRSRDTTPYKDSPNATPHKRQ